METRELRYFLAVADESHIGRAAARLNIAQPALSRAIAQLERRLGAELFTRTARGVTMTSAGRTLAVEGRVALAAVEAAERRTRRTAEAASRPEIVLAAKAGASSDLMVTLLDAYAARPDAAEVEVLLSAPGQQAPMLRDGRADVALLHLPYDDVSGFDLDELSAEPQVLVVPRTHAVAARRSVTVAEASAIPDLPPPRWPEPDGSYPDGPGPESRDMTQLLQLARLGRTAITVPLSATAGLPADLMAVPLSDAQPVFTVIAWPPHTTSAAVASLVAAAQDMRDGVAQVSAPSRTG